MRSTIARRKMKRRLKMPINIRDIKIEGKWRNILNNLSLFLIFQSVFNKILIFSSLDGLKCLSEYVNWHADGTFYTAAKYFY